MQVQKVTLSLEVHAFQRGQHFFLVWAVEIHILTNNALRDGTGHVNHEDGLDFFFFPTHHR